MGTRYHPELDNVLDSTGAAEVLGLSRAYIIDLVNDGTIPGKQQQPSGAWLFHRADVAAYHEGRPVKPQRKERGHAKRAVAADFAALALEPHEVQP